MPITIEADRTGNGVFAISAPQLRTGFVRVKGLLPDSGQAVMASGAYTDLPNDVIQAAVSAGVPIHARP